MILGGAAGDDVNQVLALEAGRELRCRLAHHFAQLLFAQRRYVDL